MGFFMSRASSTVFMAWKTKARPQGRISYTRTVVVSSLRTVQHRTWRSFRSTFKRSNPVDLFIGSPIRKDVPLMCVCAVDVGVCRRYRLAKLFFPFSFPFLCQNGYRFQNVMSESVITVLDKKLTETFAQGRAVSDSGCILYVSPA